MTSEIESQSPRMRRDALANLAGRFGSALVWLAVTPYALQRLGPERFGVWALFFAMTGYLGTLDFGMAGAVSRFVAVAAARGDRAEARRVIVRSMGLSGALGLLWTVALFVGRPLFLDVFHIPAELAGEVSRSLAVFSVSFLVYSISQVLQWSLMGFQRFDLWNLYYVGGLAVNVTLLVSGLALGYGLIAAAGAAVAGHATAALLSVRSVRRSLGAVALAADPLPGATWRDLLRFGAVVQVANSFSVGQLQAGKVLLGAIGRLVWVTTFELAFRVMNVLWSLAFMIQAAAYPAAARAYQLGGNPPARDVYTWCCRWTFLVAGWTLGLGWLVAPALYHAWLGEPRPEVASTARWLVIAFAFGTLSGPLNAISRGIGVPGIEMLNWIIALVLNVALCLWLIPRGGPDGAAIAMAISFAVATTVVLIALHRRLEYSNREWVARIAAPRFLPAVAIAPALRWVFDRWTLDSRLEALLATAAGSAAYTVLFVAATWTTGDPRAVWARARGWVARLAGAGGG